MEPTTLVAVFAGISLVALLAFWTVLSRKERTEHEARAYLAGFAYVLSDDPDAAIAELSKAAQLNRQTLETYFALGALFRRKGELDRAVRLHCNILLRPGLTAEVKRRALIALGADYRRSGLRDKAAETFEKLLVDEPDSREALLQYRRVLEEKRDWPRAIEVQTRLVRLEGRGEDVLAHLLAEVARAQLPDHPADAEELADRAVNLLPACADAQLALGEARLAVAAGTPPSSPSRAAGPIRRALELEPELAPRSVRLLAEALASPAEVERFLTAQIAARAQEGAPYELALALHLKHHGEMDQAISLLKRLVERKPHLWEARKELGALLLENDRSEELRADYQEILETLGRPAMGFICGACRQKLPEHLFRCPSCDSWDAVRREELSAAPAVNLGGA